MHAAMRIGGCKDVHYMYLDLPCRYRYLAT